MNNKVLRQLVWSAIAVVRAWALGSIANHRGETINAIWFVAAAACGEYYRFRTEQKWNRITRCC